jgi:hypothetical protein
VFQGERNQIREASADYALGRIVHYHQASRKEGATQDEDRAYSRHRPRATGGQSPPA